MTLVDLQSRIDIVGSWLIRQYRVLVLELKNVELSFNRGQVLHLLDLFVLFLHFLVNVFELLLWIVRCVPSRPASNKVWVLPTPLKWLVDTSALPWRPSVELHRVPVARRSLWEAMDTEVRSVPKSLPFLKFIIQNWKVKLVRKGVSCC